MINVHKFIVMLIIGACIFFVYGIGNTTQSESTPRTSNYTSDGYHFVSYIHFKPIDNNYKNVYTNMPTHADRISHINLGKEQNPMLNDVKSVLNIQHNSIYSNTKLYSNHQYNVTTNTAINEEHYVNATNSVRNASTSNMQDNANSVNNTTVYISEYDKNDVIACNVQDGVFTACNTAVSRLNGPENLLVYNHKLYIVNLNNSMLTICTLDNFGQASDCHETLLSLNAPIYVQVNHNQLYVSDFGVHSVVLCNIQSNGGIFNCNNISSISPNQFKTINYANYSYTVNNSSSSITKCALGTQVCSVIKDIAFNGPLTLAIVNNYAYVSNYNSNAVTICQIQNNGDFTKCAIGVAGLSFPVGISGF